MSTIETILNLLEKNDENLTKNNECPWIHDSHDALQIAQQLEIPFKPSLVETIPS